MTKTLGLTRRAVLGNGTALATIGAGRPALAAAAAISPIMTRLSTYMSEAANKPLPEAVAEKTKQMILDTLGAMISGSELPPGKFAIAFVRANPSEKVATVAASDLVCGAIDAALINGMLAHSDETDDTHPVSYTHPGCSIVPSAMAAGEKFGVDGNRFMRSVALGYDVGTRITATLGKNEYSVETHLSTHGICGTFGSASAAACAAGLSTQQMRWVLSYAAQQASGLYSWQRDTDHIEKSFDFGGMPARNGVTAALLVQAGGTGVEDILSGPNNFFEGFRPKNNPNMIVDGLGTRYEISRTNIKKWTVGAPIQAPLDALQILMNRHGFGADQVRAVRVRVGTDGAANVNNRDIPDISIQHLVAVMLVDKTVSFRTAHDLARMRDPAILNARAKVTLVPDSRLQLLIPDRVAIVEVTLNDDRTVSERVEKVRGTAENPMPREEVIAKARDLIVPVLGAAKFQRLSDMIFGLERVTNIRDLRPLIQSA